MAGPLAGVKVVELGVWVAGPAAGGVLADWGADVIKIEPPEGDPSRTFARMFGDLPFNPIFEQDNRSKRGIVLDLTTAEGLAVAHELLAEADVFVSNVRPAALERIGLGPDAVMAANPSLIYGLITGLGTEGPEADKGAFDIAAFWARSGIASLLSPPDDGPPPFQRGGMGDHTTGQSFAGAIAAALYAREKGGGTGQMVTTSLLRQGVYTISFDLNTLVRAGLVIGKSDRTKMGNPTANHYQAGDGRRFWLVGLDGDRHWPPLARVVGHPEWIDDPRFAGARDRAVNAIELIALLDEAFATATLDEWAERFEAEPDVFWAPVQTPEELLADPQALASGMLCEVPDGNSTTSAIASPNDFSKTPWEPRSMAPELGEHTEAILNELGRDAAAIEALRATGALGG